MRFLLAEIQLPIEIHISSREGAAPLEEAAITNPDHWLTQWLMHFSEFFTILWSQYPLIAGLLTLMFIDIITGVMKAIVLREVSSKIGSKGMYKKIAMLSVVAMAWLFEMFFPKVSGQTMPWGQITAACFWWVEASSILENAAAAGVPLPKALVQMISSKKTEEAAPLVTMNVSTGQTVVENKPDSKVNMNVQANKVTTIETTNNPSLQKAVDKVTKRQEEMSNRQDEMQDSLTKSGTYPKT